MTIFENALKKRPAYVLMSLGAAHLLVIIRDVIPKILLVKSATVPSIMALANFALQTARRRSEKPDLGYLAWLQETAQEVALILVVAFILVRLVHLGTGRLVKISKSPDIAGMRSQQLRTLASIINSVAVFIIVVIAGLQILPIFGVNIGPLLASAGIAGLAIGFGAQTLVHDVINGFFILLENQYSLGDVVKIQNANVTGTVEAMTLRRTVLRDADGTLHIIPNSEIKIVSNRTRDWAQITMHVAVAYGESSDKVIRLLQEVGTNLQHDPNFNELIVAQPEVPGIERVVSGGEVDYLMLVKTMPGAAQYKVSRELRRRIKDCFEENNIKPAGPSQVYVRDGSAS